MLNTHSRNQEDAATAEINYLEDTWLDGKELHAEVEVLSRAQHENLVLFQCYCKTENDMLLLYSYMENGNLD